MYDQQFAYDYENDTIYYIKHQEKKYVAVDKSQKELYDFLLHVYVIRWSYIKEDIERDYIKVDRIWDMYE